jgi:hypothetical protein
MNSEGNKFPLEKGKNGEAARTKPALEAYEEYLAQKERNGHYVPMWERCDPELQNWFANGGY